MIRVYASVNGTFHDALLPHSLSFSVNLERPKATRIALAGNAIHQTGPVHISNAAPRYEEQVDTEIAEAVIALKNASSTCFLSDGKNLFEAGIDAQMLPVSNSRKRRIIINFRIVRQII